MNYSQIPVGFNCIDVELIESDAGGMWFPMVDFVMRDHIRSARTWESEVGCVLRELLSSDPSVFLDVGANVGYFSRLVARSFPKTVVHAFEPHPLTYQVLRMNTWEFGDQIQTWPLALSNHRGTVALSTSPNNLGDTKGVRSRDALRASVVAPSISFDELLADICPDVVKIDVQGAEMAVLQGMKSAIRRSPQIRIVMEFSPGLLQAEGVDPRAALGSLREFGFDLNLIRPNALYSAGDSEIIEFCRSAGPMGQANLLLAAKL